MNDVDYERVILASKFILMLTTSVVHWRHYPETFRHKYSYLTAEMFVYAIFKVTVAFSRDVLVSHMSNKSLMISMLITGVVRSKKNIIHIC
jgi:hypothetical protein